MFKVESYSSVKNTLCGMFVSKSIKKEMYVFGSWFCSFVCPFTIAIPGEGRVGKKGYGEGSLELLIVPSHLR